MAATGSPAAAALPSPTRGEALASARLAAIRNDPAALKAFVTALPKGGDLHNHLSGAVSTEYLVSLAAEDGLCTDETTLTAVRQAWSMQDCPPGTHRSPATSAPCSSGHTLDGR